MYFLLSPDIKVVRGTKRDVCHSLLDGKVYYFELKYRNVFRDLLNKKSLEELTEEYDEEIIKEVKEYICANHIGHFTTNNNIYITTIKTNPIKKVNTRLKKFNINSIMLRVTSSCNLNCAFCNISNQELVAACTCFRSGDFVNKDIKSSIDEAIKLGIERVELIGGEPFLEKKVIFEVVNQLATTNIALYIHTNGTLLTEADIIELAKNNVYIIYSVYTLCEENERKIVGMTGYVYRIFRNIELLRKYGLKYHIEFLVNIINKSEMKSTMFRKLFLEGKIQIKYIFPTSEYSVIDMKSTNLKIENKVISFRNYEQAESSNLCFREGPFIDVDGEIYPCIGLAKEEFRWGNIKEGLFSVYRDGKHEKYWKMSNESDTECSSCAERLMCKNCKAYKILYANQKNICEYKK